MAVKTAIICKKDSQWALNYGQGQRQLCWQKLTNLESSEIDLHKSILLPTVCEAVFVVGAGVEEAFLKS